MASTVKVNVNALLDIQKTLRTVIPFLDNANANEATEDVHVIQVYYTVHVFVYVKFTKIKNFPFRAFF